eukprot:Hpha_TRINITY_DN26473_c0_g1::TRINITY_DN26473_c0_g1_i1::g.34033::m.34033
MKDKSFRGASPPREMSMRSPLSAKEVSMRRPPVPGGSRHVQRQVDATALKAQFAARAARRKSKTAFYRGVWDRISERIRRERELMTSAFPIVQAVGRFIMRRRLDRRSAAEFLDPDVGMKGMLGIKARSTLDGLYHGLIEALEDRAILLLSVMWLPICALYHKRRRNQTATGQGLQMLGATRTQKFLAAFSNSEVFGGWPRNVLESLAGTTIPGAAMPEEILQYEGEPAQSSIMIVLTGSVLVRQRKTGATFKGFGLNAATEVAVAHAPMVFGDYSLLCDEPRMGSLITTTRCELAFILQRDFLRFLSFLPHSIRSSCLDSAYAKRKYNLVHSFQVTEQQLRKAVLFRDIPAAACRTILDRLQPKVAPPGTVLCTQGDRASEMFFIARGKVGLRVVTPEGKVLDVAQLGSGAVFGEWGLLFSERRTATALAVDVVELWVLDGADFFAITNSTAVRGPLQASVNAQRLSGMQKMKTSFTPTLSLYISRLPLLRRVATAEQVSEICTRFTPAVYSAGDIVCTRSEAADRVIILTRGKAFVADGGPKRRMLAIGEGIGYTCLIVHRWLHAVVASSNVDTWELPRNAYIKFLKNHKLWKDMLHMTYLLMQPYLHFKIEKGHTQQRGLEAADFKELTKKPKTEERKPEEEKDGGAVVGGLQFTKRTMAVQKIAGRIKLNLIVKAIKLRFIRCMKVQRTAELKVMAHRKSALQTKFDVLPESLLMKTHHIRVRTRKAADSMPAPPDFEGQVKKLGRTVSMLALTNPDLHPTRPERVRIFAPAVPEGVKPKKKRIGQTLGQMRPEVMKSCPRTGLIRVKPFIADPDEKAARAEASQRAQQMYADRKLQSQKVVMDVRSMLGRHESQATERPLSASSSPSHGVIRSPRTITHVLSLSGISVVSANSNCLPQGAQSWSRRVDFSGRSCSDSYSQDTGVSIEPAPHEKSILDGESSSDTERMGMDRQKTEPSPRVHIGGAVAPRSSGMPGMTRPRSEAAVIVRPVSAVMSDCDDSGSPTCLASLLRLGLHNRRVFLSTARERSPTPGAHGADRPGSRTGDRAQSPREADSQREAGHNDGDSDGGKKG